jgi:hypothetical protein
VLNVKVVCNHFPWSYNPDDEGYVLLSPENPSQDRSKTFRLIMQKIWRLKAFSSETKDIVQSFYPIAYQSRIADYNSFESMLANTEGTWLILTDGRPMNFANPPRFILVWVAPWAVACSSRCAYLKASKIGRGESDIRK